MEFETELCKLAFHYGTDKCPQLNHSYTPFYYRLLNPQRQLIRKVLELGIGHPERMNRFMENYRIGASLYMWRDFFPQAMIYGADIMPETMFEAERIRTFLCDETRPEDLRGLIAQTGPDLDLVVDDASHARRDQINACLTLMPLLQPGVIYIIEDINHPRKILQALGAYDCLLFEGTNRRRSDKLIMVRHRR